MSTAVAQQIAALLFPLTLLVSSPVFAQTGTATLAISVQATPSNGRPEKVRRHTFYLLRQNLASIEQLARQQTTAPALAAFVDEQNVSEGLKAWMKRTGLVNLLGKALLRALNNDDIMDINEFRAAYTRNNLSMVRLGFPRPKMKLKDRANNPEKWEKQEKQYWDEVRAYLELHPESRDGMDQHLLDVNPGQRWLRQQEKHKQAVRQTMLRLVHSRFLVAQTETDIEGAARFTGIEPGRYWLTNLWSEVRAGDVRLRWELPIELPEARTFRLELSNANALPRP